MRALSWAVGGSAGGQLGPARLQRRGATSRAVLGLGEEAREVPSGGRSCPALLRPASPVGLSLPTATAPREASSALTG